MSPESAWNPYTPPQSTLEELKPRLRRARIEGRRLVVPRIWESPPICLRTGELKDLEPPRQRYLWPLGPGLRWALPVAILLYNRICLIAGALALLVLVYQLVVNNPGHFILRPRVWIVYYLSRRVWNRHRWLTAASVGLLISGPVLMAFFSPYPALALMFIALVLLQRIRTVRITKISAESVWLSAIPENVMEYLVQMDAAGPTGWNKQTAA